MEASVNMRAKYCTAHTREFAIRFRAQLEGAHFAFYKWCHMGSLVFLCCCFGEVCSFYLFVECKMNKWSLADDLSLIVKAFSAIYASGELVGASCDVICWRRGGRILALFETKLRIPWCTFGNNIWLTCSPEPPRLNAPSSKFVQKVLQGFFNAVLQYHDR